MTTETTFEAAKLRYHTAHVAFAKIDGQVIDASATLEELRVKHTAAADELNQAREALVQARSPAKPEPETETAEIVDPAPPFHSNGSAVDRETVDSAIDF